MSKRLVVAPLLACGIPVVLASCFAKHAIDVAPSRASSTASENDASPIQVPDQPTVEPGDDMDPEIAKGIGDLFEQIINARHPPGTTNVKRAVFLKPHGCMKATFTVAENLPEDYRVGLFKETGPAKDAWIRISTDNVPSSPDQENNTIGFAIKVLGVEGEKILPGEEHFKTHDFLTQNHSVFFVDTAKDFLEFTQAVFANGFDQYIAAHPRTGEILDAMKHKLPNVLASDYWSTTPYKFGPNQYAKYKVKSCNDIPSEKAPATSDKNYLRKRLIRDVAAAERCFDLQVHLRRDDTIPLDAATVDWDETATEPVTVAHIKIPAQDIKPNDAMCEKMSFTAWHALPEHRPVGSVNKARGIIYKRMADLRRTRNNVPISEPE